MAQIFHRSTNTIARLTIFGGVFGLGFLAWAFATLDRSDYTTRDYMPRNQPVPFSHKHHVSDDGIDCRYCHTTVEVSNTANIPPTKTCMNCHSVLFNTSPMLEPVRESYRTGMPILWTRVHDLPDFVYFNHSIHVNKGVGCEVCHGRVDQMPLTWKVASLEMQWCINCHRHPERYVRPRSEVFTMGYHPKEDQETLGRRLVADYKIQNARTLTSCSTCHR